MHFSFYKFGGREHSPGVSRGRRVRAAYLLARGGDRPGRGADTFHLFLALPVTNANWESPQCVIKHHILGQNSSARTSPQLGPGLHTKGGPSRGAWDLSFLPRFPSLSYLFIFPSHVHICLLPFSASQSSSLPFPVHSTCLKKENYLKGGGGGVSLAFLISIVAVFKVETLLEIPRSSFPQLDRYMHFFFSLK